jgi:acrylyl-CoA reductase (NADPH)
MILIFTGGVIMQKDRFKVFILDKKDDQLQASIQEIEPAALPAQGDVLISVDYSSLNYKDGLAVTGQGKIVRSYPMVPGIDLAGTVIEPGSSDFKPGDPVVVTGWGVGESYWGGYAQMARMKAEWLVPLPDGLSLKQTMAIGTAGFTAMLCIMALEEHGLEPDQGDVVVTGAAGGVGSVAVAILAKLGYKVVASTGRAEAHDYLHSLGAQEIIDRSELAQPPSRPMLSARWAGAVDAVGGDTLASLIATMAPYTSIAACGLAGGAALNTTVLPFILRGVNLLGINSVAIPQTHRINAWHRLARDLPLAVLDRTTQVAPLADVPDLSRDILKGQIRGRVVIDVKA